MTDYELSIAALLVDPLDLPITWKDIGGLDSIIQEIIVRLFKYKTASIDHIYWILSSRGNLVVSLVDVL